MRNIDIILSSCQEYDLLSEGQFVGLNEPMRSFKPSISPAPHISPIVEPTFKTEPFKYGPTETRTIKLEPSAPKAAPKSTKPSAHDVFDEHGKVKPGKYWEYMKGEFKGAGEAVKQQRIQAKKDLINSLNKSILNIYGKLYKLTHPTKIQMVKASIPVILGLTAYVKFFANQKPASNNKEVAEVVDEAFINLDAAPGMPDVKGSELISKISGLTSKLKSLKPRTPRGEKIINDSMDELNNINKSLTALQTAPNLTSASSAQSYSNLATSFALTGVTATEKLDLLASALEKSNKLELANEVTAVSNDIAELISGVNSVKSISKTDEGTI